MFDGLPVVQSLISKELWRIAAVPRARLPKGWSDHRQYLSGSVLRCGKMSLPCES